MALVAVVGTVLAIGAVVLGFFVDEPWTYGPVTATEDWQSILTWIIIGAIIAIQTLVVYAALAYLDAKAEALGEEVVTPVTPVDPYTDIPDSDV